MVTQNWNSALQEVMDFWTQSGFSVPDPQHKTFQSKWETQVFDATRDQLLNKASTKEDEARLRAASVKHAGDWLNVLPSTQLGTHFTDDTFRISMALRLGSDIFYPHRCRCGQEVNSKGLHGLKCKFSAGRLTRHSEANDTIKRALTSAQIPSIREPAGCSRSDGKKPDGLTLIPWKRGTHLVWDYTATDTYAPSYLNATSMNPGAAAVAAEERKRKKYEFLQGRFIFVAVAQETSGIWGPEATTFLKSIGQRISEVTNEKRATSYLLQRLSVVLQRGNAASILGSLPPGKDLHELFLL
jgi:hypothetical protein